MADVELAVSFILFVLSLGYQLFWVIRKKQKVRPVVEDISRSIQRAPAEWKVSYHRKTFYPDVQYTIWTKGSVEIYQQINKPRRILIKGSVNLFPNYKERKLLQTALDKRAAAISLA